MPIKPKTFDIGSRVKTVETWEKIHETLQANPGRVLHIDNETHAAAVTTCHALNRIRVALRTQNPGVEGQRYEYIKMHVEGSQVLLQDRYWTIPDITVKTAEGKTI